MNEFTRNVRYALRKMWTWWETYLILICFFVIMTAIVSGSARQAIIHQLEDQIEVIKYQNENSIKDRSFLHSELQNTRDALKRLENKVKSNDAYATP